MFCTLDEVELNVRSESGQSLGVRGRDQRVSIAVNQVDGEGLILNVLVVHLFVLQPAQANPCLL